MSHDMDWVEAGYQDGYSGNTPNLSEVPIGKLEDYQIGYADGLEQRFEDEGGGYTRSPAWNEGGY